ncbi:lipase family protein [Nocardia vulneris]|uniref:lipase family protein n=1 Tax=Nocardia vulneris TaxID=1141657 RepID=UPI0030D0AA7E
MTVRCARPIAMLALTALVLLAGCGSEKSEPPAREPGQVIETRPLMVGDALAAAGTATYLRYVSTAASGQPIEVSGAVFLPAGQAPRGGWPLVGFGHGTAGVTARCAPTGSPNLFGAAGTVAELLRAGYAVAMTNFQGLDGPGAAPYLDSASSGYNVLDAIRAAGHLKLPLSEKVALLGVSQGGRATEAAAESAPRYAPELQLVANVLISPALRLSIASNIDAGTLSTDQYLVLPYVVSGIRAQRPDFGFDQILHGQLLAAAPALATRCTGDVLDSGVAATLTPDQARFTDAAARAVVTDFQQRTELPQSQSTVPTLLLRANRDVLVETAWSDAAAANMCRKGIPLRDVVLPGDHNGFESGGDQWQPWLADRFANRPAQGSTCG